MRAMASPAAFAIGSLLLLAASAGSAAAVLHDPDGRIAAISRRIAEDTGNARLWVERAELFRNERRFAEARDDLAVARSFDPRCAEIDLVMARLEADCGDDRAVLQLCDRLKTSRLRTSPELELLRGRALAHLGRDLEAAQAFDRAAARGMGDPDAVLERFRAHLRCGASGRRTALELLDAAIARLGPLVALTTTRARHFGAGAPPLTVAPRTLRSADRVWGPRTPVPPLVATASLLVPAESVWRYRDDGSDQGIAWRAIGFDDSSWAFGPGQLGYGDGDEATVVSYGPSSSAKYITTWFRHSFVVPDPSIYGSAYLRLMRDDGAVVFLNGVEVARHNMPSGTIGYLSTAAGSVGGTDESLYWILPIPAASLAAGDNALAVEIHQYGPTSSDISFDLELFASTGSASIVRGPYLQRATPTAITVRWRTDVATDSGLWLGSAPNALSLVASDPAPTTEHQLTIGSLTAETAYFYGVGTATELLAGGDGEHRFVTPPPTAAARPTRIWAIGDSGTAKVAARAVRDAYQQYAGARSTDVWLMLGDNAYDTGTDPQYQTAVFDTYPDLLRTTALWPTLGNHDGISASSGTQTGPYYDNFTLPTQGEAGGLASGTEAYYAFDHGDVHFVCLDSHDTPRGANDAMAIWLAADLAASTAQWNVVFFHHPPYTKGTHDSDNASDSGGRMRDMREIILPLLEAAGVDLVLCGHSHVYERSFLLDGHYDVSSTLTPQMVLDAGGGRATGDGVYAKPSAARAPHEGAVYAVAGSSGQAGSGSLDHPAMFVSLSTLGSMVIDVDGDRLDAVFLDALGSVRDSFAIEKGLHRTLKRDAPSISLGSGGRQDLALDAGAWHAGRLYLVLGSLATEPGFDYGGIHVPLVQDAWFGMTAAAANSTVLQSTAGQLDGNGRAQCAIVLGPGLPSTLIGLELWHAGIVLDAQGFYLATNPVRLVLRL